MAQGQTLFQLREGEKVVGEYPNLWQAAADWNENPTKRSVVRIDGEGRTLQQYTADECRSALKNALNPNIR